MFYSEALNKCFIYHGRKDGKEELTSLSKDIQVRSVFCYGFVNCVLVNI